LNAARQEKGSGGEQDRGQVKGRSFQWVANKGHPCRAVDPWFLGARPPGFLVRRGGERLARAGRGTGAIAAPRA